MKRIFIAVALSFSWSVSAEADSAGGILRESGVKGGLVAVVGCDDPALIAGLRANDSYIVHALDTDSAKVDRAREHIRSKGLHGNVSAATFDGEHLPYADNLVNLIVVPGGACRVSREELERVLVPGGMCVAGSKWRKPVPANIDSWSHHVHGPDGNPVANDSVVGPPRRMQWQAGPRWSRAHDSDSSIDAVVTTGGRIFYMADDAPASLSGFNDLPDKWMLTARDAFNGVLLWKRPVEDWGWRAWKGNWYKGRADTYPRNIHRRIVAAGDRLYATLGYRAAVSELDAATGEVLQAYAGTEGTREVLLQGGQLLLTVPGKAGEGVKLVVLDPRSGKVVWETKHVYAGASKERTPKGKPRLYSVLNAAADDDLVCLMDGKHLVCLERKDGKQRWRVPPRPETESRGLYTGTLITSGGVILYAEPKLLVALSAEDGRTLWRLKTAEYGGLWFSWKDVFVIDGLVWTWSPERKGKPIAINGYALKTGKLDKSVPTGHIFNVDHHHRCYRNKATPRYVIASRRGAEFVDLEEGDHSVHIWVRGICFLGMMPANGLLYAPPHPCKCYLNEKLSGFCALAGKGRDIGGQKSGRLEKGAAFGAVSGGTSDGWVTFRGDAARSGCAATEIPSRLAKAWRTELNGRVTAPVVADGKVFVACVDAHTVHALDEKNGKRMWHHIAGGRVDSPPTYHEGTVLFGSADGWLTCLRASDGEMVWRYRAAPAERLVGIHSRLESAWPVHGSPVVEGDTVYCAAGRSSYLDGGIHVYGLDAATGKVKHHALIEGPDVDATKPDWYDEYNVAFGLGAVSDILQAVDGRICMANREFKSDLTRSDAQPERVRLMGGMLDSSQYRRTFWFYGREMTRDMHTSLNYRPKKALIAKLGRGDMLVHDARAIYGARRFDNTKLLNAHNHFVPGKGDLLFATGKGQEATLWESRIPVRVRTMLVAGDRVAAAGPPEGEVDPKDPLGSYENRKGGILWIASAATGEKLNEYKLDAPPVFNGLAAANRRLYWSTTDGTVVSYKGSKR